MNLLPRPPHVPIWATVALLTVVSLAGSSPAVAATLNVSPKNEKTLARGYDGTYAPRSVKYKLTVSDGPKVKWKLKKHPKWVTANPLNGTVKGETQIVKVKPDKAKIETMDPGIHTGKLVFQYKDDGVRMKIRRNVAFILEGDPGAGLAAFNAGCSGCHDLYVNKTGPYLVDAYGRNAGTADGYSHSAALVAYGRIWEERNLDAWLENPQGLVPDAKMFKTTADPVTRMDLIAYLKAVSP